MASGSNLVDLFGRDDMDEDLMSANRSPSSSRFAQQWQLRMRAHEAAIKVIANSKLRRLLAYNESVDCTDVHVGTQSLST